MKIPPDKYDKIWETISIILLLAHALLLVWALPLLPERVAVHFDFSGRADGWGNKNTLWYMFLIAVLFYGLMTYISFRPDLYHSRMTKNNLNEQFRLTSKMVRTVKAFILLAFICLTIFMFKTAQGKWTEAIPLLVLIFLVIIIIPCIYYAVKISRIR